MASILRIPKTITLPFGYRVTVKQLPDKEFDLISPESDGVWMVEQRLIVIRKKLPAKRRAYILAHELGHAWLDWQHNYLDEGLSKP